MNYWLHPEAQGDLREAAEFYRMQAGTALAQSFLREFEYAVGDLAFGEIGSRFRLDGNRNQENGQFAGNWYLSRNHPDKCEKESYSGTNSTTTLIVGWGERSDPHHLRVDTIDGVDPGMMGVPTQRFALLRSTRAGDRSIAPGRSTSGVTESGKRLRNRCLIRNHRDKSAPCISVLPSYLSR